MKMYNIATKQYFYFFPPKMHMYLCYKNNCKLIVYKLSSFEIKKYLWVYVKCINFIFIASIIILSI